MRFMMSRSDYQPVGPMIVSRLMVSQLGQRFWIQKKTKPFIVNNAVSHWAAGSRALSKLQRGLRSGHP